MMGVGVVLGEWESDGRGSSVGRVLGEGVVLGECESDGRGSSVGRVGE